VDSDASLSADDEEESAEGSVDVVAVAEVVAVVDIVVEGSIVVVGLVDVEAPVSELPSGSSAGEAAQAPVRTRSSEVARVISPRYAPPHDRVKKTHS
jgi:hypothetical protein